MSHKRIRTLIERAIADIHDNIQYSYGKDTDFNQDDERSSTRVNVSPLTASIIYADNNVNNYSKGWNVEMGFYKYDVDGSNNYQEILDSTDDLVDKFINRLNLHDTLVITAMSQTAFIQAMANPVTGHILTFTATFTDDFDYCEDC